MIRDLQYLKYLKFGFAILFGICLAVFFVYLIDFLVEKIKFKKESVNAFEDVPTIREMNRMAGAVNEFKSEMRKKTWGFSFVAVLCFVLLIYAAVFHNMIIEKIGIELFIGLCLAAMITLIASIVRRVRYKDKAVLELGEYINLLSHIYPDFHDCIRLVVSPKYVNVPFSNVITAIYRCVQEISDADMLVASGTIMQSELLSVVSEEVKNNTESRVRSITYIKAFEDATKGEKIREASVLKSANVIGFSVICIVLFSLCLLI